jgi:DNA-binding MarR family transcriptional regulator
MGKAHEIGTLLRKLTKTYQMLMTREWARCGLTLPQMIVLREISQGPKTIGQISQSVDLSYSTISGIIDRLERNQLVERVRDENDRRVIWIRKTRKIEEMMGQVSFLNEAYYAEMLEGITGEQMDAIISTLQVLIGIIEQKVEENA